MSLPVAEKNGEHANPPPSTTAARHRRSPFPDAATGPDRDAFRLLGKRPVAGATANPRNEQQILAERAPFYCQSKHDRPLMALPERSCSTTCAGKT
jgi:hypothetical protein